jgi:hypothetical protein
MLKYVQVFMVQTAHSAIANARGRIDQRLARWLLMAHDCIGDNTLPLTQEFLAHVLGVRRADVTEISAEPPAAETGPIPACTTPHQSKTSARAGRAHDLAVPKLA